MEFPSTIFSYIVFQIQEKIFPMTISLWLSHGYYPNSPDPSTNSNGMFSFPSFLLFFFGNGKRRRPAYLQNTDRKHNLIFSVDDTELPNFQTI